MTKHILIVAVLLTTIYSCECERTDALSTKANTTDTVYSAEGDVLELKHFKQDTLHYIVEQYYRSGQIRFKGEYGAIKTWSIPIGEHIFYREDGTRDKRIVYKYENEDSEIFDKITQLQEELTFHHDGKTPKQSKLFRGSPDSKRSPCGEWYEFNEEGHKKNAIIYDHDCM
jgi:antitoxin component YwqK of YwqJK toxin-antitoxin module